MTSIAYPDRPLLLGLTGAPDAGKSTIGLLLQTQGWRRVALADAARVEVAAQWGIDPRLLIERHTRSQPLRRLAAGMAWHQGWSAWLVAHGHSPADPRSPEWLLRHWMAWRRSLVGDYWARQALSWAAMQRRSIPAACVVITDVTRRTEAAAIRDSGGYIVGVQRSDAPAAWATDDADLDRERDILVTDANVRNDGTTSGLVIELQRAVRALADAGAPR